MNFVDPILALGQGIEIFPFFGALVLGGVAGLALGSKKLPWVSILLLTGVLVAFGVWLMANPWGAIAGSLAPLLYLYGRFG